MKIQDAKRKLRMEIGNKKGVIGITQKDGSIVVLIQRKSSHLRSEIPSWYSGFSVLIRETEGIIPFDYDNRISIIGG